MAYSGQRRTAFDAGFNDALFGRDRDNPYKATTVRGSYAAYEEGYESGLLSDSPPRGPRGEAGADGLQGATGAAGQQGAAGVSGSSVHTGSGAPAADLGGNGDVYIDGENGDIWEHTGTWSLQGSAASVTTAIRTDTVNPAAIPEITYRGDALPGTAPSASAWRVQRLTVQADGDITIEFASGSDAYNQIWDDRLALSYS